MRCVKSCFLASLVSTDMTVPCGDLGLSVVVTSWPEMMKRTRDDVRNLC